MHFELRKNDEKSTGHIHGTDSQSKLPGHLYNK